MKPFAAPSPFSFILFGASGNLAKLKIYPALYVLALKKRFPENFSIVGYARTAMDDVAFRKLVEESIKAELPEVNPAKVSDFLSHVHYQHGSYDNATGFAALNKKLETIEKGWKDNVRLAYLSIPPTIFSSVLQNLVSSGLHDKKIPFRCIVEKPVGHDLRSFEILEKELRECFRDDEIFLLDHYLGKEAVRNIYYLRFANPMLEALFQKTLISHVEITAMESLGLEGRAGYFEHTGTLRDMFQSHLLMMASLLTMHVGPGEDWIPASRLRALKELQLPPVKDLSDVVIQGQYGPGKSHGETVAGYNQEDGVTKNSRTNTYCALKLQSRETCWNGVPFYLRSGKRMGKKETRVTLQFKESHPVGEGGTPNRLDIILQGEAGMRIVMQTKVGGTTPAFRPLIMEDPLVCMGDCLPEHGLLLLEAINGKQTWFLTFEEVRAAWKIIDPLQKHLEKDSTPLHLYPAGGSGPKEADEWVAKEGVQWVG